MSTNQIQTNWPLQKPQQLVYVELGPDNGGMVLGICEQGLSFRAVAPVKTEGPVYFTFALDGKTRLNGAGEIAWLDDDGKSGGLKFTNISQQFRETLHAWLASEATPKAIGREVTPAASLPLDSLNAPKPSMRSASALPTPAEETKPAVTAAPSVPSETKPTVPKPVIPAPIEQKPQEIKPVEPKRTEPKPTKKIQPEHFVNDSEAQVPAAATSKKIEPEFVEAKPEPRKPEIAKPEPAKPAVVPRVEPVLTEAELHTVAPLPAETHSQTEPTFSLPGFRLPSA